ncbi:hypothetical protein EDC01DRAFT_627014 [Geopyxis carbonaria]|nr:hypothetical protein EDC01DRAFT_627014 [Geopyxis carbonaria]
MAVFGFFGLCFLVVAGWINFPRCPDFPRFLYPMQLLTQFTEWLGRRRSAFHRKPPHPPKPWKRPADTKFWQKHSRPSFEEDFASLLPSSSQRPTAYNTFPRMVSSNTRWYPGDYPSSPEDDNLDDVPSMRGYSPRTSPPRPPPPRPPLRTKTTNGILAGRLLSTRRSEFRRTLSLPGKVSKPTSPHRGLRRKLSGSDGEDESSRRVKRPASSRRFGGFGKQRNQVGHKGLDVVLEEAGSTPERF